MIPYFCFLSTSYAQGIGDEFGINPFINWKEVETSHFKITYPENLRWIVQRSAELLEEAHTLLAPKLYWQPLHKTQVLLLDNSDLANGLAAPIQRIGMVLWVSAPENWFSTTYYDDRLRMLILHEYTHILNMDITQDIWKGLRILFGDTFLPNSIWPSWMLEGLAVFMETRYTSGGRGRSPYYEMILRAAVEENLLNHPQFITLDKINGENPWYPGGETPYLFGFQLMNQISKNSIQNHPQSLDGKTLCWDHKKVVIKNSEDQLGVLSLRSSSRFPFFINGNLSNITGKDFYTFWNEWVEETTLRMKKDLEKIKSEPVTKIQKLTHKGFQVFGPISSPDKKHIAYTQSNQDQRSGLWIYDTQTKKSNRLSDKYAGVGLAFSPSGEQLFFSQMDVKSIFGTYSDLAVWDLKKNTSYWLSDGLRARDPDISKDGKWITFTLTKNATTHLALGELKLTKNGRYKLQNIKTVFEAQALDRVSNPKFSPEGNTIVFSYKKNGVLGENIFHFDLMTQKITPLTQGSYWNRFPTYAQNGDIYFISSKTGVDNLFLFDKKTHTSKQITNVTTGVWFPSFLDEKTVLLSHFSTDGFDLGILDLSKNNSQTPINSEAVKVSTPKIGTEEKTSLNQSATQNLTLKEKDYSPFSSLLPRTWAPGFILSEDALYIGGIVLGYDALDFHRYIAALAYDTQVKKPDTYLSYSNRNLAITLTGTYSNNTQNRVAGVGGLAYYERKQRVSLSASYPFKSTWSVLTPSIGFNLDQTQQFTNAGNSRFDRFHEPTLRELETRLRYSNAEYSRLSISAESGRTGQLGVRVYDDGGDKFFYKFLTTHQEHLRLSAHSVLVPFFKGSYVTGLSGTNLDPFVQLTGRNPRILNPLDTDGFDQITVRGYPSTLFAQKSAIVAGLEYRFPINWIFRGWGTQPLFFDSLHGVTFAEVGYFPSKKTGIRSLPATGVGLKLDIEALIRVPLQLSVDYHYGFRQVAGLGGNDFFISILLNQFLF